MEKVELQVRLRNESGKGSARKLRLTESIPAVFYGPHMEKPLSLTLELREFSRLRKMGSNVLITLKADDAKDVDGKMAVVKDHQVHPVSGQYLHADLVEVRMDEPIRVNVSIHLTGKAKGVTDGGILEQSRRELEVRCLPHMIPDRVEADVTELDIGDSLHVSDIVFPEGVEYIGGANFTIAAVVAPAAEEEKAVIAEGAAVEGVAPAEGAAATPAGADAKKPAPSPEEK